MTAASRFTLYATEPVIEDDPFGIWELAGVAGGRAEFALPRDSDTDGEHPDKGLVWSVAVPPAHRDARKALSQRLTDVELYRSALESADNRITALSPGIAFDAGLDEPEATLIAAITALRGGTPSFGEGGVSLLSPTQLYEACQELVNRFRRFVQYYARIETTIGGRLIALTVVDWSGDYNTTWQEGVTELDMMLHLDALRLALATRLGWLRLVSIVASGALSLSIKASVPGGQFLLMPAVYRFVRDILAELEQVQVNPA